MSQFPDFLTKSVYNYQSSQRATSNISKISFSKVCYLWVVRKRKKKTAPVGNTGMLQTQYQQGPFQPKPLCDSVSKRLPSDFGAPQCLCCLILPDTSALRGRAVARLSRVKIKHRVQVHAKHLPPHPLYSETRPGAWIAIAKESLGSRQTWDAWAAVVIISLSCITRQIIEFCFRAGWEICKLETW